MAKVMRSSSWSLTLVVMIALTIACCLAQTRASRTVPVPPPIRIKQHPQSQVATRASKVMFKCEYEAAAAAAATEQRSSAQLVSSSQLVDNEHVRISWLLNDAPLASASSTYVIDRNRLLIPSFEPSVHAGAYRCAINSTLYSSTTPLVMLSEPANLTLAFIAPFANSASDSDATQHTELAMSEGNVAIVLCHLPSSAPPAQPLFYHNDSPISLSSSTATSTSTSRYTLMPSGNLHIANVNKADAGTYRCGARNPLSGEERQSARRTLLRVYEPFGSQAPLIVHAPPHERVARGANVTLECVAVGAPVPLVSWEKFGGVLPPAARATQRLGSLVLSNVQAEDAGTYVCRAENGPSQATFKTAVIDVDQSDDDHRAHHSSTVQSVRRGHSLELKCPLADKQTTSKNVVVVAWYNQSRRVPAASGATLRVSAPGVYQCSVQSELTGRYAQADMFVLLAATATSTEKSKKQQHENEEEHEEEAEDGEEAPKQQQQQQQQRKKPTIVMGPQNTTVYEGQSVVLMCMSDDAAAAATASSGSPAASASVPSASSSGSANTQINWLQNELIIEPTLMRRFEINQLHGNLRIVSIQRSDAGVYKCIASNEFGTSSAEAYLHVKSPIVAKQSTTSAPKSAPPTATAAASSNNKPSPPPNSNNNNNRPSLVVTRPLVTQIAADQIKLRWSWPQSETLAYFQVEYKVTNVAEPEWLTIEERIAPGKREYVLTDLSEDETYRFRITAYNAAGTERTHGLQSARFRLAARHTALASHSTTDSTARNNNNNNNNNNTATDSDEQQTHQRLQYQNHKEQQAASSRDLEHVKVQIIEQWAASATSLGLKWTTSWSSTQPRAANSTANSKLVDLVDGFYIYYRKLASAAASAPATRPQSSSPEVRGQGNEASDEQSPAATATAALVPLYNYTRINLPLGDVAQSPGVSPSSSSALYMIGNLEADSQYEIKMTCYTLGGDLCLFSASIDAFTPKEASASSPSHSQDYADNDDDDDSSNNKQSPPPSVASISEPNPNNNANNSPVTLYKSSPRHTEILLVVLGVILAVLTLLLLIFIVMCLTRHREHKRLLAQLHNTSQKLGSGGSSASGGRPTSSCPTLVYEDSLRKHAGPSTATAMRHNSAHSAHSSSSSSSSHSQANNNNNNQQQHNNNVAIAAAAFANLPVNYAAKLLEAQIFLASSTSSNSSTTAAHHALMQQQQQHNADSSANSNNSQSMSTTTSSMLTTPPTLVSAQSQADAVAAAAATSADDSDDVNMHLLGSLPPPPPPPPVPQVPPPSVNNLLLAAANNATHQRMNINMNPLSNYLDVRTSTLSQQQQHQPENFYHTLTQLGQLPNTVASAGGHGLIMDHEATHYADYNNSTLNMRAQHLLFKQQQQQQQQLLLNTLKTLNLKQQQLAQLQQQQQQQPMMSPVGSSSDYTSSRMRRGDSTSNANHSSNKSPSASSMRRNSSATSSKKSRRSGGTMNTRKAATASLSDQQQQQQQQQMTNGYYLLPQGGAPLIGGHHHLHNNNNNQSIYNDVDLLALEAAINHNQLALLNGNLFLFNNNNNANNISTLLHSAQQQQQQQHQQQQQQQQQQMMSPSTREFRLSEVNECGEVAAAGSSNINGSTSNNSVFLDIFDSNGNNCNNHHQRRDHKDSSSSRSRLLAKDPRIYESNEMDDDEAATAAAANGTSGSGEREPMLIGHYDSADLVESKQQQQQQQQKHMRHNHHHHHQQQQHHQQSN